MELIIYLLWCMFAILDGVRDGFMYHMKNINVKTKINEHVIFSLHRLFPLIMVCMFEWKLSLSAILVFPFLHDGAYYWTRDKLQPGVYPYKWLDHSHTSTAKLTKHLTPLNRIIYGSVGVLILIKLYHFNIL